MNLCERKTAVGESLAKGLEKGSELSMKGFCCERVGERGFQYKACYPKFPDYQAKGSRRCSESSGCRLQIRNDSTFADTVLRCK